MKIHVDMIPKKCCEKYVTYVQQKQEPQDWANGTVGYDN